MEPCMTLPNLAAERFVSPSSPSLADELLDRLALYRPLEVKIVDTKNGPTEATVCRVVLVPEDGPSVDLGERLLYWRYVRRQLTAAHAEAPWVAGVLAQHGVAYRLDDIDPADVARVRAALASVEA